LLGLELGLMVGLSLEVPDSLGWTDGVVAGWPVGWPDFIDGSPLTTSFGFELGLVVGLSVGVADLQGWTDDGAVG
jgi:hypothetical protein